ncbi:MAG: GTP-binding protein [Alphaproteobacteria bacterium]
MSVGLSFPAIPVIVITGFLGSGKTTLLQRLLSSPDLADTAVLINEFGEVGLDHHLIRKTDETTVMLASGCVCCTIRDDLGVAMRDLLARRAAGEIPPFRRLIMETTGLADPIPILYTLMTEPAVDKAFRLRSVIATVDAVNGKAHLARQPESVKQAAIADRIVITKTDLVDRRTTDALTARLRRLNPSAVILTAPSPPLCVDTLLSGDAFAFEGRAADVRAWLNDGAYRDLAEHPHASAEAARHDERIAACCLRFDEAVDWTAFSVWLTLLLHRHGADVLRIKGLVSVAGFSGPVVIHGVQHVIHPPVHLDAWPDEDRGSRIVFITRGIPRDVLAASLSAFDHASRRLEAEAGEEAAEAVPLGAGTEVGGRPYRRRGGPAWLR